MSKAKLVIGVVILALGALLTEAHAVPPGGYQQSCEGSRVEGSTLFSSCKDRRGDHHPAELRDFAQCVGDIFNDNGALRCSRGAPPPHGSYAQSCEQVFVEGPHLRANCRNRGGGLVTARLPDFQSCTGDIWNENGALVCSRGGPPPAGSYSGSCRSSFMEGHTLHSLCKTISGVEVRTSLPDVRACRGTIANIDGRLTCPTGSGQLPAGSYTSSCRDIVAGPTSLTASCRTFGGADRTSTLANPSACLGPISNRDGFLTCPMGNNPPPAGSYQDSCHTIVTQGSILTAQCRRSDGVYQASTLNFAGCTRLISNRQGVLTCPESPPTITVRSPGDGSFVVIGAGFAPNATVHIRVTDGAFGTNLFFTASATATGALEAFPTGDICQGSGQLFFSANDGRVSNGTAVVSNTVTTTCPF